MLPFEIGSTLCFAAVALVLAIFGTAKWRLALWITLVAGIGLLLSHARLERWHWQMWPLYAAVILLIMPMLNEKASSKKLRLAGAGALLLVGLTTGFAVTLPMFSLPKPTGRYRVGTVTVHLVDKSRPETHAKTSGAPREINVQFWYPTESTEGTLSTYRRRPETTFLSSYQASIETTALQGVPVAGNAGALPIVLFNHAWNGLRTQNTAENINLASHGFVIASIDHTYNSMRTAFPDGRVITGDASGDIDDFARENMPSLLSRIDAELGVETADNSFVLDTLERWNADPGSVFYQKLKLSRVAASGHSFGGAVAIQSAIVDRRISSAINLDGWVFGNFVGSGLNKPLLQFSDDQPYPTKVELGSKDPMISGKACFDILYLDSLQRSFQKYGGYLITIHGSQHMNFSDRPFYSPFRRFTSAGPISAQKVDEIISAYTVEFLEKTLQASPSPLLDGQNPFGSAITFQAWHANDPANPALLDASLETCPSTRVTSSTRSVSQLQR